MMASTSSKIVILIYSASLLLVQAIAQEANPSAPSTQVQSEPAISISADGTKTTILDQADGTRTVKVEKPDGSTILTSNKLDGTIVKTVNSAEGALIITKTSPDGITQETTIDLDGTITTKKFDPSSEENPSENPLPTPSCTTSSESAPAATSEDSTATPSTADGPAPLPPLAAPFYINCISVHPSADPTAMISTSCISAEQWAAFLNAVASYADPHQLYDPAMANPLEPTLDEEGHTTPAPKVAQITRTLSADKKGLCYTVVDAEKSAGIPGSPNMKVKELPITYVNLFDAARFCNWLHHEQPTMKQTDNPDTVTEGGAYLIDDGLNLYWKETHQHLFQYQDQYEDQFKAITLLPGALWRLPSYATYEGFHLGKKLDNPDFTEPGAEYANQPMPTKDIPGFFETYPNNPLGEDAPYEWTSTHHSNSEEATLNHRDPALVGCYYKVRSLYTLEEFASTSQSPFDRTILKTPDSSTSFRVMPLSAPGKETPKENSSPTSEVSSSL